MARRPARFIILATGVLAGCAADRARHTPSISTGLAALERENAPPPAVAPIEAGEEETARKLDLMEQALRHAQVSVDAPAPAPGGQPRRPIRDPRLASEGSDGLPSEEFGGVEADRPAESAAPAASPAPVGDAALVAELAARLRERARASSTPTAVLIRLAALELIDPSAASALGGTDPTLSPQEAEFVQAWRSLFAQARDRLDSPGGIEALADAVGDLAERMQASRPLAILDSRLCLRVDGFGMFEELPRRAPAEPYTFVAGRRHRAIVYIEPANFTHSPATEGGVSGFEVRLSQELSLFHAAKDGDTRVWHRPPRDILDFSRNRRRDFFVTQVIDLPATLSVGAYRLKVSMTDKASGGVAEVHIPLEFVAEAPPTRR